MSHSKTVRLKIEPGRRIVAVYDDALVGLMQKGEARTVRASHVEPHPTLTGWIADMRPIGGRVLGANGDSRSADWPDRTSLDPFPTRAAALEAERAWLLAHVGI